MLLLFSVMTVSCNCTKYIVFFDTRDVEEEKRKYDFEYYLSNYDEWKKDKAESNKEFIIIVSKIYPKHKLKIESKDKIYYNGYFVCRQKRKRDFDYCGIIKANNTDEIVIALNGKQISIPPNYYLKYKYTPDVNKKGP